MTDMDLCKKYRPKTLDKMIGQSSAVAVMKKWVEKDTVPHTVMFTGPSGCGKTTAARILCAELGCIESDIKEINIADSRGIDTAREIRMRASSKALGASKKRVWILDEVQQSTKDFQNALLKVLEEPRDHVYYMLCTTDPGKLLKTIQTRMTEIKMKSVNDVDIGVLVSKIWMKENPEISKNIRLDVSALIVEVSDGSPRKALKILESVIGLDSKEEMLTAVQDSESRQFGINLARHMLFGKGGWAVAAKMLKEMEDEPETVRQIVMSYANTVLLSGKEHGKGKCGLLLNCFREPIYSAPKQLLTLCVFDYYHMT